ncbi:MAG: phosphoglucosamine mutase, partial [Candidatus Eisenbacteria bacterium]|nr:phosphoglucosamine mutase [Candidatus Eisenbacteria bacterium]
EYTLAVAARAVLRRERGPVVANMSTSRMIEDLAAAFGVSAHRSPVGEANVVAKMSEVSAVVGGEGNGGVILPAVHPGRDACTAAGLFLTALLDAGSGVSALVGSLQSYSMVKTKLRAPGVTGEVIRTLMERTFPDASGDYSDGAKMTWPDRWVHARMSGTEPVARIIAEAPDETVASGLVRRATEVLSNCTEDGLPCAE